MRRAIFIAEVKNPNNRNRLLTEKLGDGETVYKIPDELWDRYSRLAVIHKKNSLGRGIIGLPHIA